MVKANESQQISEWLSIAETYINEVLAFWFRRGDDPRVEYQEITGLMACLPDTKPADVNPKSWRRALMVREALHRINQMYAGVAADDQRFAISAAIGLGSMLNILRVAPFEHYIVQGTSNTKKLTEPQKQKRLAALAAVVKVLPEITWTKTTTGINKLVALTGMNERRIWECKKVLRSADESLIANLAEKTSLSRREIRKRISRIPNGK